MRTFSFYHLGALACDRWSRLVVADLPLTLRTCWTLEPGPEDKSDEAGSDNAEAHNNAAPPSLERKDLEVVTSMEAVDVSSEGEPSASTRKDTSSVDRLPLYNVRDAGGPPSYASQT